MKKISPLAGAVGTLAWLVMNPAFAQTAVSASTSEAPVASAPVVIPYLKRYVPEGNLWELGVFGGLMFPASDHQLFDPSFPASIAQPFKTAGELGLRVGYFPLSFVGVEAEAAAMPAATEDGSAAGLWALRGHVILQLPGSSITPFVLAGAGALGASSDAMGNDNDDAVHFGIGAKAAIDEHLSVRLDIRDTLTRARASASGTAAQSPEVLIGLTFVPKRRKPDADGDGVLDHRDACPNVSGPQEGCPNADADGDGLSDEVDECKDAAGAAPSGCPDGDGDGLLDRVDLCPDAVGPAPSGCPPKLCPIKDTDGDGLTDDVDECPAEAARTINGCVIHDQDGDGLLDAQDQCPAEPETRNGFQDADGCPDVIPEQIAKFTGVIQGIEFDFNSAKIKRGSERLLKEAAAVLKSFPELRLLVTGHTDNQGDRGVNVKLSEDRAASVKAFLLQEGALDAQLTTKGSGPDLPLADNATPAGRQKNRRIEFAIVQN